MLESTLQDINITKLVGDEGAIYLSPCRTGRPFSPCFPSRRKAVPPAVPHYHFAIKMFTSIVLQGHIYILLIYVLPLHVACDILD